MDQSAVVVSTEAADCELSEGFGAAWIVLHQTLNVISPWKLETRGSWSTETPVTPSVTSTAFFLTPHLKQTKASESAGTKRFKMCVSQRCLPTFLSESSRFLLCPWSLGSGLPAQEGRSTNSPPPEKSQMIFLYFGRWTDRRIRRYLLAPDYKLLHPLPAFFPDFPSFPALESTLFYYSLSLHEL